MTRESNSAPAWHEPVVDPRVLETVHRVQEVNQLGPSEVRRRAKTIPLGERPSISHVPTETRTSNVVAIAHDSRARHAASQGSPIVQPRAISLAETCAKNALSALREPFSYESAARQLGWSMTRARTWMRKLVAKGELRSTREGHFKTEAWRR